MTEPSGDLLPLYDSSRGFDSVMRGYDRNQVDREISRLDDDLRLMAAERDSAAARSADLAAQLASVTAQVESLRRQLVAASEPVTADNIDERVSERLRVATADVDAYEELDDTPPLTPESLIADSDGGSPVSQDDRIEYYRDDDFMS